MSKADSLFLLSLIVVPLDGEEHAHAKHENLERNEDYGNPIHHFKYRFPITNQYDTFRTTASKIPAHLIDYQ
jgi:hypothetical protein